MSSDRLHDPQSQYSRLCAMVNELLESNGHHAIEFERYENLAESIYAFPAGKLLEIDTDRSFIIEAYYKITDWSIDTYLIDDLVGQLQRGEIDREGVIARFESCEQKRDKHTQIIPNASSGKHAETADTAKQSLEPILYVEISSYVATRAYSGIQRVVREFANRLLGSSSTLKYKFLSFDPQSAAFVILPPEEMQLFLQNPGTHIFREKNDLLQIDMIGRGDIFLDMDAVWSNGLKRAHLYPKLKSNGIVIANFIHDMIPVIRPYDTHYDIVRNFATFADALYRYSDIVFFNSRSSQRDFLEVQSVIGSQRYIPSLVVKLGASLFTGDTVAKKTSSYDTLLNKQYILFVGTIEPRKNHSLMLEVFEELHRTYDDLHLIFIGIAGWSNDTLIHKLSSHPLLGERLHWFEYVDDDVLRAFYGSAYMVVYLSSYEGFGLPVAESLGYGNITVTSKNSSIYEVGKNFADYLFYDTHNELSSIIAAYLEKPELYNLKRDFIKNRYEPYSWDIFYSRIYGALKGYGAGNSPATASKWLFVAISFDRESLAHAISMIDANSSIVASYLIVTSAELSVSMSSIESIYPIKVVTSELRSRWSILTWLLPDLPDTFLLFGDDILIEKPLAKDHYIKSARYRVYHSGDMLDCCGQTAVHDRYMANTRSILEKQADELLCYTTSIPQIIDRRILREIASRTHIHIDTSIEVLSYYCNRAISLYPHLFEKIPQHTQGCSIDAQAKEAYRRYNLVHKVAGFADGDASLLCYGLPYFLTIGSRGHIDMPISYKAIGFGRHTVELLCSLRGITISTRLKTEECYNDDIAIVKISSGGLKAGEYDLFVDIAVDDRAIYGSRTPYMIKLIVQKPHGTFLLW